MQSAKAKVRARTTASATLAEGKAIIVATARRRCHFLRPHAMGATARDTARMSARPPIPTSKAVEVAKDGIRKAAEAKVMDDGTPTEEKEKDKEKARAEKDYMSSTR